MGAETRLLKIDKKNVNTFEMQKYKEQFNLYSDEEKKKKEEAKFLVDMKFSGKNN